MEPVVVVHVHFLLEHVAEVKLKLQKRFAILGQLPAQIIE
jgi:hypothetical protein